MGIVILLGLLDVKVFSDEKKKPKKRWEGEGEKKHKKEKGSQKREGEKVEIESVEVASDGRALFTRLQPFFFFFEKINCNHFK